VHTYGSEADLHKDGTVKRQIGYGDEMLPEVQEHHEVENMVVVSVRGLVDSFSSGVAATLEHIKADEPSRALFTQRLQRMVQEVQFA
jgi:hypothetical protein